MAINNTASADQCIEQLLDLLPPVVGVVRKHMRSRRSKALSIEQFRAMVLLHALREANLSEVADFLGASLPTTSRLVSGLVDKNLVNRCPGTCDRRQIKLVLTARGRAELERSRAYTRGQLVEQFSALKDSQRHTILEAMQLLRPIFVPRCQAAAQPMPRQVARTRVSPAVT